MGMRCSKPPKYSSLEFGDGSLKRLLKLTTMYDNAVDVGNLQLRGLYGSEMLAICKELGYSGDCCYPNIRVFAGGELARVKY